jgi:hypothetical protein
MTKSVGASYVAKSKNLYFKLSENPRDEIVNISSLGGNFVIDRDGLIYEISGAPQDTAAISVVGGADTFSAEKQYRPHVVYITPNQKVTIYNILKEAASLSTTSQIYSDNDVLNDLVTSVYYNYCG